MNKKLLLLAAAFCLAWGAESSKFSANIEKYWQENNMDKILKERKNTEEFLAQNRAKMLKTYGQNKEILGSYDKNLAAVTQTGVYVGKMDANNVLSWKGIPYAKAPKGDLRWKKAQEKEASDKIYEAYYFGKSSVQVEGGDEPASLYPQGEDCLNLNVWNNTASKSKNKPIMVWIHGGAYIQGGANTDIYDGTNFVLNHPDVIFVSIDYRTDFLGFINLSKVPGGENYKDSANLGLLDEIAALKWLKENASAFGGDANRITIFGESAGGGSVSALMLAPQAKGLFKRGIMQSGVSSAYLRSAKTSIEHTNKIMQISGAKNIDDLKALSIEDIRKIATIIVTLNGVNAYTYPQRDDIVIPMDIKAALESNARKDIDMMIGTTKNEFNYWTMILGKEANHQAMKALVSNALADMNDKQKADFKKFMSLQKGDEYDNLLEFINYRSFHVPARFEATSQINSGGNAYVYFFAEESNDKELLSYHGYDIDFVLGNLEKNKVKELKSAENLSKIMQQMWVNFAKTGDPSLKDGDIKGVNAIKWEQYKADSYPVMVFDAKNTGLKSDPAKIGSDLLQDIFWLRIK